jgi:predicted small lipoprotein YifL
MRLTILMAVLVLLHTATCGQRGPLELPPDGAHTVDASRAFDVTTDAMP